MRLRTLRAVLLLAAAAAASRAQVEKIGTSADAAAAPLVVAAPSPVSLTVAPLSAAPALSPSAVAAFSPSPAFAAAPAAAHPSAPPLAPALAAPQALPVAAAAPAAPAAAAGGARVEAAPEDRGETEASAGDERGRELFDAAAPAQDEGPGLWSRLKGLAGFGERVPAWPGAAGDKLRVGKRSFTLEAPESEGTWRASGGLHLVRLASPGGSNRAEIDALRALEGTEIPHAALVAASADGRALVKERLDDDDARTLFARGFEPRHTQGWAELAARLIRAGVTGDLSPGNLVWQRWRTRWLLADARGVRRAEPGAVLESLLGPGALRAGVEPGKFLAAVRARLGPDSPEWARTAASLRPSDRAALAARDGAAAPGPALVFGPAEAPPFPNDAGSAGRIAKALGYDPLGVKPRLMLHADDPGKLNTEVFSVQPPGKARVAVKIAEWGMIRRELALRRVVRRWFGRWFDAPSAFGVEDGYRSYLVMEFKEGSPDHYQTRLTLEQRAALAVLAHAFGLSDMNPGNVLFPARGKPVLLDFEQALSRRRPSTGRVPDESIAFEMPWMNRFDVNRAEDYQPATRAWRALLVEPASKAALVSDFRAAGYSAEEAAALLRVVEGNTADLDWTIAVDVEFVNQFSEGRGKPSGRRGPS